jgi:hypothetical protein
LVHYKECVHRYAIAAGFTVELVPRFKQQRKGVVHDVLCGSD